MFTELFDVEMGQSKSTESKISAAYNDSAFESSDESDIMSSSVAERSGLSNGSSPSFASRFFGKGIFGGREQKTGLAAHRVSVRVPYGMEMGCGGGEAKEHHKMTGEVYRDDKQIFSNTYVSGGGVGGYRDGLKHHTEPKFLSEIQSFIKKEDHISMKGQLNPCKPGCQPAIRKFVQDQGVTAEYTATQTQKKYNWRPYSNPKLKGTVIQKVMDSRGAVLEEYRYWQDDNNRWKRAKK